MSAKASAPEAPCEVVEQGAKRLFLDDVSNTWGEVAPEIAAVCYTAAQVVVPDAYRAGYLAGLKAAEDAVAKSDGFRRWVDSSRVVDEGSLLKHLAALRGQNTEGGA